MVNCDKCGMQITAIQLNNHKENECPFSEKVIQRERQAQQQAQQQQNTVECPLCFMGFPNQIELETHLYSFHPELFD